MNLVGVGNARVLYIGVGVMGDTTVRGDVFDAARPLELSEIVRNAIACEISLRSPMAMVITSVEGEISVGTAVLSMTPHANGVVLSSNGEGWSIDAKSTYVWTLNVKLPHGVLIAKNTVFLTHLYISATCSALEEMAPGCYVSRDVQIDSNFAKIEPSGFLRLIESIGLSDDPGDRAVAQIFRDWHQLCNARH